MYFAVIFMLNSDYLSVLHKYIRFIFLNAYIGRSDYFIGIYKFFKPMGTPAGYPCTGKDRGIELRRKTKHMIYKTAVEVDIGAYSLVDMSLLTNYLRCKPFYHAV